eukprot:g5635.t1 g5635   contig2:949286-952998(+)
MSDSDDEAPKGVIPLVDVDLTIVDTDDEAELKNASRRFRTRFQKNSENKRKLKVLYSKLSRDGDDGDDSALPDALFPVAPLIRYQKPFYHCGAKVYAAWTQDAPFRYYCGTIMASKCYGTSNFGDIRRYDIKYNDGDFAHAVPEEFVLPSKEESSLQQRFEEGVGVPAGIRRKTFPSKDDGFASKHGWFVSENCPGRAFHSLQEAIREHTKAGINIDGNNTNVGGQKPPSVSPQGKHEDSDRSLFSHDDEDENADVESDGSLFPSDDDDKQKPPATAGKPKETDGEYLKARKNQYKRSSHAFNDSDLVITPVVREEKRLDYFRFIFEGSVMVKDSRTVPPVEIPSRDNGKTYWMVYCELKEKNEATRCTDNMGQSHYRSYYVTAESKTSLCEQLLSIAAFDDVVYEDGPEKALSRFALCASSCVRVTSGSGNTKTKDGYHGMFRYKTSDVEFIDDDGEQHLGCGFIPKEMLAKALGGLKRAQDCYAVQVRWYNPGLFGIGKGMLCVKDGIDKIQIPRESMLKVGKSANSMPKHRDGFILSIVNLMPSSQGYVVGKILFDKDPTKSDKGKLKPPASDAWRLLFDKGVRQNTLKQYVEDYKFGGIRHASVIGLIDPTGSIPNGMVYIPGMGKRLPSKIFITRSPCTEVSHGRVVEVAKELPPDAFQFFNREYSFGSVVFALEKENPLPMKLADGDLDGDWYFICWDDKILSEVEENVDDAQIQFITDALIGHEFEYKMKGKWYPAQVVAKVDGEDSYEVTTGPPSKKETVFLKKWQIHDKHDFIQSVSNHRLTGSKNKEVEFEVNWGISHTTKWESVRSLHRGMEWITTYLENHSELKEIKEHKNTKLLCSYECCSKTYQEKWMQMHEVVSIDKVMVGEYAKKRNLFGEAGWEQSQTFWFDAMHDMIEGGHSMEMKKLIVHLNKLFKKVEKTTEFVIGIRLHGDELFRKLSRT